MEGREIDHQSTMVKIRGKISTQRVSILIDSGACHTYISPKVLDDCKLSMKKHIKHWLAQLATCAKQNNSELVKLFEMDLNYLKTSADLIILPLVAYNIMLGMDWLEKQHVILDCLNKNLTCIDDQGNYNVVYGVDKKISIR